jgi:hypothetical protein
MRKGFARFGQHYKYDVSYLEELAETYPAKALRYMLLSLYSGHRPSASKEAYFAAKITAAHMADCGPCTNLAMEMALEAGIDKIQLQAIVLDDDKTMTPDILLGYNYARAVVKNTPSLALYIRDITVQFGKRGLWDMSSAVAMGGFFPTLKRGLGEAKSCLAPSEMAKEIGNG